MTGIKKGIHFECLFVSSMTIESVDVEVHLALYD